MILEGEAKLETELEKAKAILTTLDKMDNGISKDILIARYIQGLTIRATAEAVGYSSRCIPSMTMQALAEYNKLKAD